MKKSKRYIYLALTCLLLSGCTAKTDVDSERFYAGELKQQDMAGLWMVTETDLHKISALGYKKYTNQLDHVILLNNDGTCAYRKLDRYRRSSWGNKSEEELFSDFAGESFVARLKADHPKFRDKKLVSRSWYLWQPNQTAPIKGPYATTNGLDVTAGALRKNRWSIWKIADRNKGESSIPFEDIFGCKYRYRIEFSNPDEGFRGRCVYMHVGKSDDTLFLWRPVEDNTDGNPLRGADMIRFYRATPKNKASMTKPQQKEPKAIK